MEKSFGDIANKIKDTMNNIEFDPDKRIEQFKEAVVEAIKDVFNPDSRVEQFNSTEIDRIKFTPSEDNENGTWENGERGNGEFVPDKNTEKGLEIANALSEYGLSGIEFKQGIPDFSRCSKELVSIDEMTDNRHDNFKKADTKLAKQWNKSRKDGREDWTAREIKEYRTDNELTWHECSDMKTCMLVDRKIHDFFRHSGGIFEYNQGLVNKENGGIFDE